MPHQQFQACRYLLLAFVLLPCSCWAFDGCRRQVYLDLGANWANTLRLHYKLQHHVRQSTQKPADPMSFNNCTFEWEIYAFEASPVMHPFIEAFVKHLNNQGERPALTVPPVGGSIQMLSYAKHFGCPSRHNHTEYSRMYKCMNRIFRQPYSNLAIDPALNDTGLIQRRLDEALYPNRGKSMRYTFIPAAVGAAQSAIDMEWPAGVLLYVDTPDEPVPRPAGVPELMRVAVIDWVEWLKKHFRPEDIIIVKMDVEGAEHPILRRMMADGGRQQLGVSRDSIHLIDVLGLECHAARGMPRLCPNLLVDITRHGVRLVSEAAYSPSSSGVDPFSHVKDMMPIDPRLHANVRRESRQPTRLSRD